MKTHSQGVGRLSVSLSLQELSMRGRSARRCETVLAEVYDGWCLPCGFRQPAMLQKTPNSCSPRPNSEVEMFQADLGHRELWQDSEL
jgi:hypothetical protein